MSRLLILTLLLATPLLATAQLRPITMLDQIKNSLPLGLELRKGKHWQPQAVALANATLKEKVLSRPVVMTLHFERIEAPRKTAYGEAIVGHVTEPFMQVNGVRVDSRIFVYFTPGQLTRLGAISGKRDIAFEGKIARADFSEGGRVFNLDFTEAKVGVPDKRSP